MVVPRLVVMARRTMAMRGGRELMLHESAASAMPHDLAVGHAMTGPDRPAREMGRRAGPVGRPIASVGAVVRARGVMSRRVAMYPPRVPVAHINPAVARTRTGHGRKRRRCRRLGLGRGYGLSDLRHRLPGRGRLLLRAERRSEHPERDDCAGKDDDTLHDALPTSPANASGEPRSRIDGRFRPGSPCRREFDRTDARIGANARRR